MLLQFRDSNEALLDRLEAAVIALAEEATDTGPVRVSARPSRRPVLPTDMDAELQRYIAEAAAKHAPGRWMRMPSAAGHDPMVISPHLPCAMLFIPSIDGISHDFAEDSKREDIVNGCQVLAEAAESILREMT